MNPCCSVWPKTTQTAAASKMQMPVTVQRSFKPACEAGALKRTAGTFFFNL